MIARDATAYYFGTYGGRAGHYLWDEHRNSGLSHGGETPWGSSIDGKLNPNRNEGEARLHHKDGWTALGFANYTDDKRPNSNSVFFFEGTLTFDEVLAAARERFPWVMARLNFPIFLEAAAESRS